MITLLGIHYIRGGIELSNGDLAQMEITDKSGGFSDIAGINGGNEFNGYFRTAPEGNAVITGNIGGTLDRENWTESSTMVC